MLIDYSGVKQIYIVCGKTDMRKSIDGLASIIQDHYNMDVFENSLCCTLYGCMDCDERNAQPIVSRLGVSFN